MERQLLTYFVLFYSLVEGAEYYGCYKSATCNFFFSIHAKGIICVGGTSSMQREKFISEVDRISSILVLGQKLKAFDSTKVGSGHFCKLQLSNRDDVPKYYQDPVRLLKETFRLRFNLPTNVSRTSSIPRSLFFPKKENPNLSFKCSFFRRWKKWKCFARSKYSEHRRLRKNFKRKKTTSVRTTVEVMEEYKEKELGNFISRSTEYCHGLSKLEKWQCFSSLFGVKEKQLIELHSKYKSECSNSKGWVFWRCLSLRNGTKRNINEVPVSFPKINTTILIAGLQLNTKQKIPKSPKSRLLIQNFNVTQLRLANNFNTEFLQSNCHVYTGWAYWKCITRIVTQKMHSVRKKVNKTTAPAIRKAGKLAVDIKTHFKTRFNKYTIGVRSKTKMDRTKYTIKIKKAGQQTTNVEKISKNSVDKKISKNNGDRSFLDKENERDSSSNSALKGCPGGWGFARMRCLARAARDRIKRKSRSIAASIKRTAKAGSRKAMSAARAVKKTSVNAARAAKKTTKQIARAVKNKVLGTTTVTTRAYNRGGVDDDYDDDDYDDFFLQRKQNKNVLKN